MKFRFRISVHGANKAPFCVYETDDLPIHGHGFITISFKDASQAKCMDVYSASSFSLIEIKELEP